MRVHRQIASAETHMSNSCIHVHEIHLGFFLSVGRKSGVSLRRWLALLPALHMSTIDVFPGCAAIKHPSFLTVSLNQTDYFCLAREKRQGAGNIPKVHTAGP